MNGPNLQAVGSLQACFPTYTLNPVNVHDRY